MKIGRVECLDIVQVADHGVPNEEHIAIYVEQSCNLAEFLLVIGLAGLEGQATPVKDHLLWFGYEHVNQGDWIIVYTAAGSTRIRPAPEELNGPAGARVISLHWGKDHTIFQNRSLVPMIVEIGAIGLISPPEPKYQGASKQEQQPRLF
ncbi:hypothetical protein [Pseudomonas moraviensis]